MIGRAMQGRFGKLAATEKRGYLSTTVEKAERLACEKADAMVAAFMIELPSVAPLAKAKLQALHGRVAEQDRRAFLKVNHGIDVAVMQRIGFLFHVPASKSTRHLPGNTGL
jgi:hypothetical protein